MTREKAIQITKINLIQQVAIFISVAGVVTAVLNLWLVANLSSVKSDVAIIARDAKANDERDIREHPTFVTQTQFGIHREQINRMEDKLDRIYTILKP